MGAEEKIWTNEHVTQHGLGRLLCLSSHRLPDFKYFTEFYCMQKSYSFLNCLSGSGKYGVVINLSLKEIFSLQLEMFERN